MVRLARLIFVLAILTGCTISPPQMTVAALDQTFAASTATAQATAQGTATSATAPTLTLSIQEVTAAPTPTDTPSPSIIDIGDINGPPAIGEVYDCPGMFLTYKNRNIRSCASLSCDIDPDYPNGTTPYRLFFVEGCELESAGVMWVCIHSVHDAHGAQECQGAILYYDLAGQYGDFVATSTPSPTMTATKQTTPYPTPTRIVP